MSTWARTSTGDMVLPGVGLGAEAIETDPVESAAIRINDGLQLWLGDWKLDQSQGFPWQSVVNQKTPSLVAVSNLLRTAILELGAPVVVQVTQLTLIVKRSLRDLSYTFTAKATTGAKLVGGSNGPNGLPYVVTA